MMIYTSHPDVIKVALKAFPNYTGKKFRVDVCEHPISVSSYWDGGSRSFYNFVRLDTLEVFGQIPQQSAFDKPIEGAESVSLFPGICCVKHTLFCGKDMGLTIMIHPDNAPKFLPAHVDMTEDEKIVLSCTKRLKPAYRLKYSGMSKDKWDTIKASLVTRALLNSNGSITDEGRNAIGEWQPTPSLF